MTVTDRMLFSCITPIYLFLESVAELMEVHKFGSKRSDELPDLGK